MSESTVNLKGENNVLTNTEYSYLRIIFFRRETCKFCVSASTLDVDTLRFKSVPPLRQKTCKKNYLHNYFCSGNEF